jgi:hypothetical protein
MGTVADEELFWETAERVCTARQALILRLRDRHGLSLPTIARANDLSVSTVTDVRCCRLRRTAMLSDAGALVRTF